jgi:hypothetical protein
LIRCEFSHEFQLYFPEWKQQFTALTQKFDYMCDTMQATFDELSSMEDKTQFARRADQFTYAFVMFQMVKSGFSNVREYLALSSVADFEVFLRKLKHRTSTFL